MEINKVISKDGLKWRCRQHPKFTCDLICLDGDSKDRVICLNCAQKQQIPLQNLISMSFILSSSEHDIFEAYPPLKDHDLSEKLRNISLEQQLEQFDVYFKRLREDIEKEVQAAEKRTKEALIRQEQDNQELQERYKKIAEIEKLKELLISDKESAEKDLDSFITDKWSKAEENRKIMKDLMDKYESKYQFSSDEPNRLAQKTIQNLKAIDFFKQNSQQLNLLKSTFGSSQSMKITKIDDSIFQLKQVASGKWGQVFVDPILDPFKKYILTIELEAKPGNNGNLEFGLMKDEEKDKREGYSQYMYYQDNSNSFGIIQQIKGNPMPQFGKVGKHSFEVRIHLSEQILRVASLPYYSSIAELDDPKKIDPKVAYRFFFAMYDQGDMMRVSNFRSVSKFDKNM